MALLLFDLKSVLELCAHAIAAPEHRKGYEWDDEDATKTPALMLVGDQGVYLMSNGLPALPGPDGEPNRVVYAEGTDPKNDPDWYHEKRALYGGDDGVDTMYWPHYLVRAAADKPDAKRLVVELTPNQLSILGVS